MRPAKRTVAGIAATATLLTLAPAPVSADSSCYRHSKPERRMARKINHARSSRGIGRISLDPELSRVATKHSRVMARQRKLFHTPTHLLSWRVTRWSRLGENVGFASSVRRLHHMFMASPTHRANVLSGGYRHVGVAVKMRNGMRWTTVIFESTRDPGTRMDMPRCG